MSVLKSMMQSFLDSLLRNKELKNALFWLLGQRCSILAGSFGGFWLARGQDLMWLHHTLYVQQLMRSQKMEREFLS
jgi:hypothetical protein